MFRPLFKPEGILIVLILWTVNKSSRIMLIFLQGIEIKRNESRWVCPSSEPLDTILCFSEYPNDFQVVWRIGNLCASFSACYLEAVSQEGIVLWTVHLCMRYFILNSSNILLKVNLVKWIQHTFSVAPRDSVCGWGQTQNLQRSSQVSACLMSTCITPQRLSQPWDVYHRQPQVTVPLQRAMLPSTLYFDQI